jgi:dihydroorotase-like cyclic amidohydrolase
VVKHFLPNGKELIANPVVLRNGWIIDPAQGDVCIVDPHRGWVVDSAKCLSKGRSAPYQGMKMLGRVLLAIVGGRKVFDGRKEEL